MAPGAAPNLDFDGPGSTDILITYVYDVAFRDGAYGVDIRARLALLRADLS